MSYIYYLDVYLQLISSEAFICIRPDVHTSCKSDFNILIYLKDIHVFYVKLIIKILTWNNNTSELS